MYNERRDVATIYNVGKIKADNFPGGKIMSSIGSKAVGKLSTNKSIPDNSNTVNKNSSDTQLLHFYYTTFE